MKYTRQQIIAAADRHPAATPARLEALAQLLSTDTSGLSSYYSGKLENLADAVSKNIEDAVVNCVGMSDWALVQAYIETESFEDAVDLFEEHDLSDLDAAEEFLA